MKKSFEIADLIVAFIQGEISPEDLHVLDEWLELSEENKALFVSFMDEAVFAEERKTDLNHLNRIFEKIKERKQYLRKERNKRLRIGWMAGIAASMAIIFGIWWMREQPIQNVSIAEFQPKITVGQQKAYLTLASGEKIELAKNQQDTITTATNHQLIILNQGQIQINEKEKGDIPSLAYNVMEVPRGAEYSLILPDGTKVWLNADSKLKFPMHFEDQRRYVELSGEAYFAVTRDEKKPFVVHSGDIDITVLGTEFCVSHYTGKPILTTLVQGRVEVADKEGWKAVLKPGQQAVTENGKSMVHEVETLYYTAWKDGYFIFANTPLKMIMEKLALWYNCQFSFETQDAAELRITARLKKYDEIDVLLNILSKTREIQFEKKGNTILIRKK